jgi:RNA polymerase I-specific transcription initiation factor RRN5
MLTPPRACISCKKLKERCDRGTPCSNCVRHKTLICVYPENSLNSEQLERPENSLKPEHCGRPEQLGKGTETNSILEAIPEAQLLHPQLMLSLSKTLFMNRSPTIPSPWPHWSEYTSEFAEEPSIYRSAFNDFHTLVVSVTKRLMQTAITQATSRLRSQRPRVKKGGGLPLVKRRDVLAAIDIVGMKRNGKERWRGVARRCSLRVYDGYWSRYQNNKTRREVPWDEVEKIMTVIEPSVEALTTDAETPDTDTPNFKSRAVRSGTPLPMERLALSDSEDDDSADDSDDSMSDDAERLSRHTVPPTRDAMGRYISVAPTIADRGQSNGTLTLEQFDTEASRQEEHTLWQMLGLEPPTKDEDVESDEDNDESDFKNDEKIVTQPDGWRSWVGYHAEWEEFSIPMSPMEFTANQKPLAAPPVLSTQALDHAGSSSDDCIEKARVADSSSDDDTGANTYSRQRSQRKSKHNAQQAIELQARGALAYAALQSRAKFGRSEDESNANNTSNSSGNEENLPYRSPGASNRPPVVSLTDIDSSDSSDTNADQPTQSIETRMPAAPSDDESTDTEIDRPTQSVKAGSKKSPVVVSDDDDSSDSSDVELDRPTRPIQTGTRRPPALHSDDEMGEMDWDTFIE